ncbi:MAG: flagellar biosynthetic protein FliR [Candidatus Gastranaerophilales bacterium]|mgnify:CR=1 FL=1|jgi:flagellar biosynthetic protein FliR|nr:flagellar biosynthetic protein FliR [Candidatus Gastranaerophilales bacterium]
MTNDLSMFLSTTSLITFLLVFTRIIGMIATAPLFSTFPCPYQIKAGLAGLSAFVMYPFILQVSNYTLPNDLITFTLLLAKELSVGLMIGFSASLIFTGIQVAGHLLSMEMGIAMANALDPITQQQVPIVGQFYLFMASILFIFINGHQWLFSSIHESYVSIPIGLDFSFSAPIVEQLIVFFSRLFATAFSLILPIFEILMLITILMGFLSKVVPQMNVFMVVLPLKIYIGLSLMVILMPPTAIFLMNELKEMMIDLNGIFSLG